MSSNLKKDRQAAERVCQKAAEWYGCLWQAFCGCENVLTNVVVRRMWARWAGKWVSYATVAKGGSLQHYFRRISYSSNIMMMCRAEMDADAKSKGGWCWESFGSGCLPIPRLSKGRS